MDKNELKAIIESLLFVSTEPLTVAELKKFIEGGRVAEETVVSETIEEPALEDASKNPSENETDPLTQLTQMKSQLEEEISKGEIKELLGELAHEYEFNLSHGFELVEVAKGFQFRTKQRLTPYVKRLYKTPPNRLSAPGLETLAIVAYQQPVGRAKVEEIRGVESGGVLRTLLERDLIRVVGRSEEPGRPLLYGTTGTFLEIFGLQSLSELPTLKDLEALEGASSVASAVGPQTEDVSDLSTEDDLPEMELALDDSESHELIEDLENSLRSLRDLEKKIFNPEEEKILPSEESEMSPIVEEVKAEE